MWLRISYVVIVLGLAVCCVAALRPDLFGIGQNKGELADAEQVQAEAVDALVSFSVEREQLRSMQLAQLDEMIHSGEGASETIDAAQRMRLELLRRQEIEQTIAGILRARGYTDAAAAASEEAVTIMIRADSLTAEMSAVILELVLSEADVAPGDIKIIPIN
ncbi:MAG: SpoIIIAH-like family protein [Christensenellales bacterium]|jgi:hypothetical protein